MSNVIEFGPRRTIARPDEWRRQVMIDVLIAVAQAASLEKAREIAVKALVDVCDEVPA